MDRLQLLRNFQKKKAGGEVDPYGDLVDGVHPDWLLVSQRAREGACERLCVWGREGRVDGEAGIGGGGVVRRVCGVAFLAAGLPPALRPPG